MEQFPWLAKKEAHERERLQGVEEGGGKGVGAGDVPVRSAVSGIQEDVAERIGTGEEKLGEAGQRTIVELVSGLREAIGDGNHNRLQSHLPYDMKVCLVKVKDLQEVIDWIETRERTKPWKRQ